MSSSFQAKGRTGSLSLSNSLRQTQKHQRVGVLSTSLRQTRRYHRVVDSVHQPPSDAQISQDCRLCPPAFVRHADITGLSTLSTSLRQTRRYHRVISVQQPPSDTKTSQGCRLCPPASVRRADITGLSLSNSLRQTRRYHRIVVSVQQPPSGTKTSQGWCVVHQPPSDAQISQGYLCPTASVRHADITGLSSVSNSLRQTQKHHRVGVLSNSLRQTRRHHRIVDSAQQPPLDSQTSQGCRLVEPVKKVLKACETCL